MIILIFIISIWPSLAWPGDKAFRDFPSMTLQKLLQALHRSRRRLPALPQVEAARSAQAHQSK